MREIPLSKQRARRIWSMNVVTLAFETGPRRMVGWPMAWLRKALKSEPDIDVAPEWVFDVPKALQHPLGDR